MVPLARQLPAVPWSAKWSTCTCTSPTFSPCWGGRPCLKWCGTATTSAPSSRHSFRGP